MTLKSMPEGFENISVTLVILGTLPMTSCSSERSFSAMKRLKDYSRRTVRNERLDSLALLYIHRDKITDYEKVINQFTEVNRRFRL